MIRHKPLPSDIDQRLLRLRPTKQLLEPSDIFEPLFEGLLFEGL